MPAIIPIPAFTDNYSRLVCDGAHAGDSSRAPEQMVASLAKLTALSGETRICCGHEYALANLRFAVAVEPESAALRDRLRHGQGKRAAGCPQCRRSLPTTVRPIRPSAK